MAPLRTIKGPAIFVAQGIQIPLDPRLIDVSRAAIDPEYCASLLDVFRRHGIQLTELSSHLQGQLIAMHPAYDSLFNAFAHPEKRGNPKARQQWVTQILYDAEKACAQEGVGFTESHIIPVTMSSFDDFAAAEMDRKEINALLGLG